MVTRRPLVVQDGYVAELPVGDTVTVGTSPIQVVAGSGLVGGGSVTSNPRLDVALAPNPSGIIFVGDSLGIDGWAQVGADYALASGSAAATLANSALASGNASLVTASAALASGNAALSLSSALPRGGQNSATFVAGSAIASGYAVGLDDAGKLQSVRRVDTGTTNPIYFPDLPVYFSSTPITTTPLSSSSVYNSVDKCVVTIYRDNVTTYGLAIVGTVSGTSISFGTAVVFRSAGTGNMSCAYDSTNNRVVISYRDAGNSNYGTAVVGTVSGTSISFGTAVVFRSAATAVTSTVYDSTNNKVVISYQDGGNASYGTSIVGTVSGTSISFGTAVVFEAANTTDITSTYDSTNNRIVVAYRDTGNLSYGTAAVGTVSGTSISFGTPVVFESANTRGISATYDSTNNKVFISYYDTGNSSYATAIVGTVSGTSISFGTAVVIESSNTTNTSCVYDFTNNKIVVSYIDFATSSTLLCRIGTISGTSVTFGSSTVGFSSSSANPIVVYDSFNNKVVFSFTQAFGSARGAARVADTINSFAYYPTINSYVNVLGVAQNTVASGFSCAVSLPGSVYVYPSGSLTPGSFYYSNPVSSGITSSSTRPTAWRGVAPWNYIGRAVSSSGLMLLKSI